MENNTQPVTAQELSNDSNAPTHGLPFRRSHESVLFTTD